MGASFGRRQPRLRTAMRTPPQGAPDGQAELPRQIVGLVEPATDRSHRVQRNRHHGVRGIQQISAAFAHQLTKRLGEETVATLLEGMHHSAL
jgi:hypothetical protein